VTAKPTTKKGLQTRAKILDGARQVFASAGYVDARMTEIAAAAGLSTGGLYRYFTDKTDVFAALIEDLHEELYRSSGTTEASFAEDPRGALLDANRGYIQSYFENRDVMRAFIEAAAVDSRFREIWWNMRQRHVTRFATALRAEGIYTIDGAKVELVSEAMACMVEQCCYVWLAHADMRDTPVSVEEAVEVVTNAWYAGTMGVAAKA
jgi:AcrR family transcriptional regulator